MDGRKDSYEDILHRPHPVSRRHPPMPAADRAAQFSPFAALSGYDAAIEETARLTEERPEADEQELNRRLQRLLERVSTHPTVTLSYFQPDEKKDGGACRSVTGAVKKIDLYRRTITLEEGPVLPLDQLLEISGELFRDLEE